jgi:hypothetical protein
MKINEHAVMVPIEQCCKQVMRKRSRCSLKAQKNGYCHQHQDRTLYALVSYDTGVAKRHIDDAVESLISHMGWEQVKAFQNEMRRGQLYEDAGGYFIRAIGKLFGARGRYDELDIYKRAAKEATKESHQ